MTNYYHRKGNQVIKCAFLDIIQYIMKENATASFIWLDEGYENDKQRISFSCNGQQYRIEGVGCPNDDYDSLPLTVSTDGRTETITFTIGDIKISTLEKIACEVYNTLWDPEKDEEWDRMKDMTVGYFLDTYLYPEMKTIKRYKAQRSFD